MKHSFATRYFFVIVIVIGLMYMCDGRGSVEQARHGSPEYLLCYSVLLNTASFQYGLLDIILPLLDIASCFDLGQLVPWTWRYFFVAVTVPLLAKSTRTCRRRRSIGVNG